MKTSHEIIEYVGIDQAAIALGISPKAIKVRLATGKLPASWYNELEHLSGRPLPRSVFSFKGRIRGDGA